MKKVNLILLLVIAGVFAFAFSTFFLLDFAAESSMYTDFDTAKKLDRTVHVVGEWVKRDEVSYENDMNVMNFWMQDSTNTLARVKYLDPMPANFESAEKVVVIGKFKEETFVADKILMKCPSKYNENEISLSE